jgi:hypothetical protein
VAVEVLVLAEDQRIVVADRLVSSPSAS